MEAQLVGGNDSTIYSYLQRRVCDKGSVLDQREMMMNEKSVCDVRFAIFCVECVRFCDCVS